MGKIRDFRADTIENIRDNLADDENAGSFWDSVADRFRDVFSFNKTLDSDLGNFDKYMGRICEINNITVAKLKEIIDDVHIIENTYSNQISMDTSNTLQIKCILDELAAEIGNDDFEKSFDKAALDTKLGSYQLDDTPPDFSGLSPDLAVKVLSLLPEEELPAALALLSVDDLCDLNIDHFNENQQYIYYQDITRRLNSTVTGSLEEQRLIDSFYSTEYARYYIDNPAERSAVMAVIKYELTMTGDDVNKVNNFLEPLDTMDEIQIKYLAYSADEPYRSLWIRYLDQFEIVDTAHSGVFTSGSNTLAFDLAADRNNPRGSYYTFFHECGHAIDYFYGLENGSAWYSTSYTNGDGRTLSECNRLDVENNLNQAIDDFFANNPTYSQWSDDDKKSAHNAIVSNLMNYNLNKDNLTSDQLALQQELADQYSLNLRGADNESASDIYGGVTNMVLAGSWGNSPGYWVNSDGSVNRTTNKESFAEYYGRIITTEPQKSNGMDSIETYLPESRSCMDDMFDSMK